MRSSDIDVESNVLEAESIWGPLPHSAVIRLRELIKRYRLSVAGGDLQHLENGWYVTHSGLLGLAYRHHCAGINVQQIREFCDSGSDRWMFRATVYKKRHSKGFVGYGDANPSNVSFWVRGAEMRVAETRAVNRALRKAYGIGLCSVEELGWVSESPRSAPSNNSSGSHTYCRASSSHAGNRSNGSNGSPSRLRDKLCLLIRQYNLDPTLVKEYAAHFCGTETIKDASRDLVESFIAHLSSSAKEDIDGLICKLNSFSRPTEVKQ
jgi:hypothetical protein